MDSNLVLSALVNLNARHSIFLRCSKVFDPASLSQKAFSLETTSDQELNSLVVISWVCAKCGQSQTTVLLSTKILGTQKEVFQTNDSNSQELIQLAQNTLEMLQGICSTLPGTEKEQMPCSISSRSE